MEIVSLSSTNFIGLTSNYKFDNTLKMPQNMYYTEHGVEIPFVEIFANSNDTAVNNYSNLYLSKYDKLESSVYIEDLSPLINESFATYLAVNAYGGINSSTKFVTVQEPPLGVNTAQVSVSGTQANIDNSYFFTIVILSDTLCKVEHVNNTVSRYLTVDSLNNISFAVDVLDNKLGDSNPQIFNYLYDRTNDLLVLSKTVSDVPKYISYSGSSLVLIDPVIGTGTAYPLTSIFRLVPRNETSNTTKLFDPWVGYEKNFHTNSQDINTDRSYENVNSNILLNAEYYNISGSTIDVNLLSLKNTSTPENYQSRGNPFQSNRSTHLNEDGVESRRYFKLFTGSNQTLGNDNITLGYDSYTTDIALPPDKITYFHVPPVIYPYTQINIAESGLVEAGAIAGDHPLKSDKIFKKLASGKYTTPYGNSNDETTGTFLCSWLLASNDINTPPRWVDRYYNPRQLTFVQALSADPNTVANLNSDYLNANISRALYSTEVYDKISDLVFEPGTYYAYHHLGVNDIKKYLQSHAPNLVETSFSQYRYTNDSYVIPPDQSADEYSFNGDTYAITHGLSAIEQSNRFTMSFNAHSDDWSRPLGHQIVGNFVNDGFGVFNQNVITPTLFVVCSAGLDIFNTDIVPVKSTISYQSQPVGYIRRDALQDYHGIFTNGDITRFDISDIVIKTVNIPSLTAVRNYDYNSNTAYILCGASSSTGRVVSVDLNTLSYATIALSANLFYYAPDLNAGWSTGGSYIDNSGTVNVYNGNLYLTPGTLSRRIADTIYYLKDNNTSLIKWDNISTTSNLTTAFKSSVGIADFNIDYDGNIWILNKKNTFTKYNSSRLLALSSSIPTNQQVDITNTFSGDGTTTAFTILSAQSTVASDYKVSINNVNLRPYFDYSLSGQRIILTSPPALSSTGTVYSKYNIDTFSNFKINFINEFVSGENKEHILITRSGYTTNYQASSAIGYQFNLFTKEGVPVLSSVYATATASNVDIINNDYLRNYVNTKYGTANLNIKASLVNIYNREDVQDVEIITSLSAVDPGYHHFSVRFDSYYGFLSLFIDGQLIDYAQFIPRKYRFSDLITRPFMFGSSCFRKTIPLFKYLKKKSYLATGLKINNYSLYNIPLNNCDIRLQARQSMKIHDIHLNLPCGHRNYLEEIERYFKATIPGSKSTLYNILIKNSGITDPSIQAALEKRILSELKSSAPIYTKLNNIKWLN
jgi:hypothetical protein